MPALNLPVATLVTYVLPFFLFTAIVFAVKGRAAVQWSSGVMRSVRTNLALSLLNALAAPFAFVFIGACQRSFEALGLPHIPVTTWGAAPFFVVVCMYLVLQDLADYWVHRVLHAQAFWPIHGVHHSDADMNWTTTYRIHILETVMMQLTYLIVMSWFGLPPAAGAAIVLFLTVYNGFVHINADIHFGPLTKVFSTPRFHRWHHADDPAAYNSNFGNFLSIWDVLFGTYRVPGAYKGTLGFDGSPNHNLLKLLIWPYWQWGAALVRQKPDETIQELTG